MKISLSTISLRLRLALLFSVTSAVLFFWMGFYIYKSLEKEILHREDVALIGRIIRIQQLLQSGISLDTLISTPQIYTNMLGNNEDILWIVNSQGQVLLEVNPLRVSLPEVPAQKLLVQPVPKAGTVLGQQPSPNVGHSVEPPVQLLTTSVPQKSRLAWVQLSVEEQRLTVIAGRLLAERTAMLQTYQRDLGGAWLLGVALAFVLGWEVARRGLRPLHRLSEKAQAIGPQQLAMRLPSAQNPAELQGLAQALNTMLQRLEEGFTSLSKFSEDLAHEIRTPLHNLMLDNQWGLRQKRTVIEHEARLVSQQEEYERLARMVDSMLFLARAEHKGATLQRITLDLAALGTQLADYFEGMALEKNMCIEVHMHGQVWADSSLLRRALANLIANALRYGDSHTTIFLRSHHTSNGCKLHVCNQGPTIDPEHLPHLFDRFYRCEPSRSQTADSGGLGLAIVKSIMDLHQGEVLVKAEEQNICFTLNFPSVQSREIL